MGGAARNFNVFFSLCLDSPTRPNFGSFLLYLALCRSKREHRRAQDLPVIKVRKLRDELRSSA